MRRKKITMIDNVLHVPFGEDEEPIGDIPFPPGSETLPFFPPTLMDWAAVVRSFAVGIGIIGLVGAVYFGIGLALAVFL